MLCPSQRGRKQNIALKAELFPTLDEKNHCHIVAMNTVTSFEAQTSSDPILRPPGRNLLLYKALQISTRSKTFFLEKQTFAYHSTLSLVISD